MNKRIIIFDLDGTLAESKQPLDPEMSSLLAELLNNHYVCVISGGSFQQFEKQFLSSLQITLKQLEHLVLLPTSGASMYMYIDDAWKQLYHDALSEEQIQNITTALEKASDAYNLPLNTPHGATIENRGSQVTFSPLGQQAPVSLKQSWDPDQQKRKKIVSFISPLLSGVTITIGGMTSIDITKKGIDKAYGIKKIQEILHANLEEMLFIGDALYPGGNDAPAQTTGITCISVSSLDETKQTIRGLLGVA